MWFTLPSVASNHHIEKCNWRKEKSCWKAKQCLLGINSVVKLLYRQAVRRVRDYSVPRQKPDGEENIYIHQLLEEEQDKVKEKTPKDTKRVWWSKRNQKRAVFGASEKERGATSVTERRRNRRRQREHSGEVFEYIRCRGTVKSRSIDGVYLPQGFTETFNTAAGWKLELTDNQWWALIDAWSYAACDTGDK